MCQERSISKICLSFDDGRLDNYLFVWPTLKRLHLPATFNICTGYVLGINSLETFTKVKPMTPEMVREIYADKSMEIASHGHMHQSTASDILLGVNHLLEMVGAEKLYGGLNGLAVPYNRISQLEWSQLQSILAEKNICYVRKSVRYQTHAEWRILCRKISRLLPIPRLYLWAHEHTLMGQDTVEDFVYSVPVLATTPPRCVVSLINLAVRDRKNLVLQFHSVGDVSYNESFTYPIKSFNSIVSHLKLAQDEGVLNVVTTMGMVRNHLK